MRGTLSKDYSLREKTWETFLEFLKTLMNLDLASEYCSGYGDSINDIDDLEEASCRLYEYQNKKVEINLDDVC